MTGYVIAEDEDEAYDIARDNMDDVEYEDTDSDSSDNDYSNMQIELDEEDIDGDGDDSYNNDTSHSERIPAYYLSEILQL